MSKPDLFVVQVDQDRCVNCGFCQKAICCPGPMACIGCGACVQGCPYEARRQVPEELPRREVGVIVDGTSTSVPERITIKRALELAGLTIGRAWGEGALAAPCGTGGCYTCTTLVDGVPVRACVTSIQAGMKVETSLSSSICPGRISLGVGMPDNREFVGMDEVEGYGHRLAGIDPHAQLCVLDHFATFRRRAVRRPQPLEMLEVKRVLEGTGLRTVVVQTAVGHTGPN
jgi:ferredoxin